MYPLPRLKNKHYNTVDASPFISPKPHPHPFPPAETSTWIGVLSIYMYYIPKSK